MRWRFRSRLKSSLYQAATRVWPRVAAFWHLFVGVLPARSGPRANWSQRLQRTYCRRWRDGVTVSVTQTVPFFASAISWLSPLIWAIWGLGALVLFIFAIAGHWLVGSFSKTPRP